LVLTRPPLPVGLPIERRAAARACALHGPQGGVVWLKVGDDTAEYCPRCYQAFLDCHLKRL